MIAVVTKRVGGRLLAAILAVMLVLVGGCGKPATEPGGNVARASRFLDSIRDDPGRLHDFLHALPKGGDLHSHLSEAVSTETLIRFAVGDGLCIDTVALVASPPPCGANQLPATRWGTRGFSLRCSTPGRCRTSRDRNLATTISSPRLTDSAPPHRTRVRCSPRTPSVRRPSTSSNWRR
jgi:hypothetical protein